MDKANIRLVIVDDHHMVRRGLTAFFAVTQDIHVVGEAEDGDQVVAVCEQTRPDVVLMDICMPTVGGIEATRRLHERYPDIQVLALSGFRNAEFIQGMLRAGAVGYLLKSTNSEELAAAIRAAAVGRPTISPEVMPEFIHCMQQPTVVVDLTDREMEVLELMVEGKNNPEIAERLTISRSTARAHVSKTLAKLGVSNRTEAITLAIRSKLVR